MAIRRQWVRAVSVGAAVALAPVVVCATQAQAAPTRFKNCTELNKKYAHGVGRSGAKDHTTGKPVTTFTVNTALYNANTHLDRDKDGIACEKR